jgi:hypothetical protein
MFGNRRVACRVLGGNLRERDHLESLGLDGRIFTRKWIFKNARGRDIDKDRGMG